MRRRDALTLLLASRLRGQQYRTYSRCLPEYLAALALDSYQRRDAALAGLQTPEAIQRRQLWIRETFWKLVGGMPERTPLNVRTVREFKRDGYRIETIVYESQPGLIVPANLYLPLSGSPPYPGVLFQMGHSLNGKAAEPYQKCCQALAMLGYVVLAFDPMGQGERTYYPKEGGTLTRLESADEEHSLPGRQMLLAGDSATRMQVWDAVRSLDVLASHPSVDAKRLGSTGQSGGGTLTMFLAAVDDRLAAAAVACGNTENLACADYNPPGSVDDAEQNFIGSGPLGFDRWDTLYPLAPKPLLVLVSARDFFGTYSPSYLSSGREEFDKLRGVYRALGRENALEWGETPAPHAMSRDLRLRIYRFFERHLRQSSRAIEHEPAVAPEPEAQLYAGPTGNAVRDFRSTTPLRMTRALAITLRPKSPPEVASMLRIQPQHGHKAVTLGRAVAEGCTIEALEVESARQVQVPGWLFVPESASQSVLLLLEPNGRSPRWREGDLYQRLAAKGITVSAFDVRGIGDLSPEVGRGNPYYTRPHAEEEAYAWASLILGSSLLSQRVVDILAIAEALRSHPACRNKRTVLAARGKMCVPALFAGAIDKELARVYLAGALRSYRSLLETEQPQESFANYLPGVLAGSDLPEIAATLGSRLTQGSAWDFDALVSLAK